MAWMNECLYVICCCQILSVWLYYLLSAIVCKNTCGYDEGRIEELSGLDMLMRITMWLYLYDTSFVHLSDTFGHSLFKSCTPHQYQLSNNITIPINKQTKHQIIILE